jgi:hypothetical protein
MKESFNDFTYLQLPNLQIITYRHDEGYWHDIEHLKTLRS